MISVRTVTTYPNGESGINAVGGANTPQSTSWYEREGKEHGTDVFGPVTIIVFSCHSLTPRTQWLLSYRFDFLYDLICCCSRCQLALHTDVDVEEGARELFSLGLLCNLCIFVGKKTWGIPSI